MGRTVRAREGGPSVPAAVILAAGRGTRMRRDEPKALVELGGRPLVLWAVAAARRAGCAPVVVVVGCGKEKVVAALPEGVRFAEQARPLGTADAARAAQRTLAGFAGPVTVLPADLPFLRGETLARLAAERSRAGAGAGAACAVLTVAVGPASTFGRVLRRGAGTVERIVEYRDAGEETRSIPEGNAGVSCCAPGALFPTLARVGNANAQGEYYLTDAVGLLAAGGAGGAGVVALRLEDPAEAMSVDTPESLAEAERLLAEGGRTKAEG